MQENEPIVYKEIGNFEIFQGHIGKGQFGLVYKGRFKDNPGKFVAVKQINLRNLSQTEKERVSAESAVWQKLKHANLVENYDIQSDPESENLYFIMEYCNGGELGRYMKKKKDEGLVTEKLAIDLFYQILLGYRELAKVKAIHR